MILTSRWLLTMPKHFKLNYLPRNTNNIRLFCSEKNDGKRFPQNYKVFKDEDSTIIFDVQEERLKKMQEAHKISTSTIPVYEEMKSKLEKVEDGSYKVETVVKLLKANSARNIFVMKLPPQLNYVEYMIITSGASHRHLNGLAEIIRKEIKLGLDSDEQIPKIEGANSNWVAVDLGNIVIHIMMEAVREVYDLESLWAAGPEYDLKLNKENEDEVLALLKKHSTTLDDLQPRERS